MASNTSGEVAQPPPQKSSRQLVRGDSSTTEALFGLLCGVMYGATSPLVAHPYVKSKFSTTPVGSPFGPAAFARTSKTAQKSFRLRLYFHLTPHRCVYLIDPVKYQI